MNTIKKRNEFGIHTRLTYSLFGKKMKTIKLYFFCSYSDLIDADDDVSGD